MINDFNSGTVGWTDWNILLDEKGGPNHVVISALRLYTQTRRQENLTTCSYYYIGHFSNSFNRGQKG